MSISTTVKTIQDIMRKDAGVDGDAQRISQLVWMIFLKIFDDREAEYELLEDNYRSPIPEGLRWRNWAADPEGMTGDVLLDFVDNALFKTLKNLSLGPETDPHSFVVRAVFEDAYNYMKNGTLIRQVINKLNEIDFNNSQGGMEEDGIESNFPATYRTKETADLFLVLIMHLLEDGGRAAIVLPDGTLFGEGVKTRIKEKLLEECNLHTIVRLPNGVFNPYTGIKTNLLFFTKGEPTQEIWYYEHPYPPGYKSYSKTKPIRIEEFEQELAWWHNREESDAAKGGLPLSDRAWKVSGKQIKANGYNLDIKNPHKIDADHGDLEDMLAEYQQLLAELGHTRNTLKQELMNALGESGWV